MNELPEALAEYEAATRPTPEATARVAARLGRPRRRRPTILVAAAALLIAGVGLTRLLSAPAPVDRVLVDRGEAPLTDTVGLVWRGQGHAAGDEQAPVITWVQGELSVEVAPDRGVELAVRTDEAVVAVVGTGFVVTRDALGTTTRVTHGRVDVTCVDGSRVRLGAGESLVCRPVRAAPLLRRARALADADPAGALADVDAALVDPSRPESLDDELAGLRVALLSRLDRGPEALAAADAYLATPGARAEEVARLALGHAEGAARCRYLAVLTHPSPSDREEMIRCAEPSAPSPTLPR